MGQKVLDRTTSLSNEYEVTDILGRGGFSVVRRGKSRTTHEVVAIKTLRRFGPPEKKEYKNNTTNTNNNSRALISESLLTNELLVMRKIVEDVSPHPNVIHLYDVCEDSYGVHLILELCSGGELFDRIVGQARYFSIHSIFVYVRGV